MREAKLLIALAICCLLAIPCAWAQRSGTGVGTGMSGFGTGMSGMSGFGSGSGMGMGMNSGMGMGMGTSGFGSGMGSGFGSGMGSGFGNSGFGQSGFGGNLNSQGNQGFIGRDSSDMAAVFQQMGRNSNQFFQQLGRTMNRGGRGGRGGRNSSQQENVAPPVRVRLDVAFDTPQIQPTAVAAKVRTTLASSLARRKITAPEVEVSGDTVVLRGVAQNESQRMVIEQLVLMEPGVFAVDNQMTLAERPAAENSSDSQPSAAAQSR
jgi:BON domain